MTKLNFQAELEEEKKKAIEVLYTGFMLVKKAYVFWLFIFMIIQLGTQVGLGVYWLNKFNDSLAGLNSRVTVVETTQRDSKVEQDRKDDYNTLFQTELQFNMQILMEKQGLTYKRFLPPELKK